MTDVRAIWEKDEYYQKAKEASITSHEGVDWLKNFSRDAKRILDVGCGEGTKLAMIKPKDSQGFGIDVSRKAIEIAKRQYPQLNFQIAKADSLPFSENDFDFVYSAFAIEHIALPEKTLDEMIRVTKKNGYLCLIAPNFGAPNRASPPFEGNRLLKLIRGSIEDLTSIVRKKRGLGWKSVGPLGSDYFPDSDTVVEPYLRSLKDYLVLRGLKIVKSDSFWGKDQTETNFQKVFKLLAQKKIYPFYFWGPHLFIIAKK